MIWKKLEVIQNSKTILLLDSSKQSPSLQVIPNVCNAVFKSFHVLLQSLKHWACGTPSTPSPHWDLHMPQFLFLSYGASPLTKTGVLQMVGRAPGFATTGSSQDTLARSPGPASGKAAWCVNFPSDHSGIPLKRLHEVDFDMLIWGDYNSHHRRSSGL